ncbi:RnfABCDGE type electron transport complex subunit D [Candidatus Thiosymbion oneisti]|uniref:RnfABCDGE type electron transport complex subunit D n=1 Tax=Candidatus Thiosymbion oneisti TaxID=589554 RepID=UPI000B7D689F|nr:RnfABCDGE type electron transport complex subunit D [Candidatus Thiosymbion oneisti]
MDPRYYQLAVQIALLLFGILQLQFELSPVRIVAVVALAGLLQLLFTRRYHLPANLPSAANSALSILLLLRSNALGWLLLAVLIAIASKFLVTVRRRHLFNPSALGIVVVILIGDAAWVTPGQWGREIWLLLLTAGGGLILLIGPTRMATTLAFGAVYALSLFGYAAWLGDPWQIPLHQLQNGALLIFAFFMLSDPKTTPASLAGCLLYGTWVALLGWALQYLFFIPNAFLYALILASPLTLLINQYLPGRAFVWPGTRSHS